MKGPGTFPLERLLVIFQCIASVAEYPLNMEQQGEFAEGGDVELMSDVLLQLSTLCCANFISKGGSCPLEGSTRYRSTVDEDTVLKVSFLHFHIEYCRRRVHQFFFFIDMFFLKCFNRLQGV